MWQGAAVMGETSAFLKMRTTAVLRWREMQAYLADCKGPSASADQTNVLIFGQGRSGTTLFETLMVSTGHFTGLHEVLNTVTREVYRPSAFVRGLGRMAPDRNVILHVKPEHLGRARRNRGAVDAREFLDTLIADGWRIVHIQRRDILRQMMSKYVAQARGGFHKTDDQVERYQIDIPEAEFIAQYERRQNLLEQEARLLSGLETYTIGYETHLEQVKHQQDTVDEVITWLGLEPRPVSTRLKKIASSSPAEHLVNTDALRAAFHAKGWEWTL